MTKKADGQLPAIQYLRAAAALLVAIAHASEEAKYFFGFTPWVQTEAFGKGVDLFFVISGFIIYLSSIKLSDSPTPFMTFAKNRFIRVVPLYYISTALMVVVVVFFPGGVKEARFDIWQIITSFTFIPYARALDGRMAPILSLGWTLNYEMFFYCLFSLCLLMPRRYVGFLAVAIIITLAILGILVPKGASAPVRFWTHNIIIEFAFGIVIAMAYERYGRIKANLYVSVTLISVGFILLYYLNTPPRPIELPRFISAGVPAAIITLSVVLLFPAKAEARLPRIGVALGDSSYSLYLTHRFVQRPIQILTTRLSPFGAEHNGGFYLIVAVIGAVITGQVVFMTIERPLLKWMRMKMIRGRVPQGAE